jgi:hypothetical protein
MLGWIAENFPDDPRLGKKLLLAGFALLAIAWVLNRRLESQLTTIVLRDVILATGVSCVFLGTFIFFRRIIWDRQAKRGSGLIGLNLTEPRNKLNRVYVESKEAIIVLSEDGFE